MRFTAPALLLLLVAVAWIWWAGRARGLRRPALAARGAAALLLVLAAAGLQVRMGEAPISVVFVLDASDSMRGRASDGLAALRTATRQMRQGDRAGLIVFGADAALERRLTASSLEGVPPGAHISSSGTNVETALRAARAVLPATGQRRIVLISDGGETAGRAATEGTAAAAGGIAIDAIVPGAAGPARVTDVTRVTAPQTVHAGEPFDVITTVEGAPGDAVDVTLEGGAAPETRHLLLPADGVGAAAFAQRPMVQGLRVFRAFVSVADGIADIPDAATTGGAGAVVAVAGQPRLLYVGSGRPRDLVDSTAGYRIAAMAPAALPRAAAALADFDAVILDDVDDLSLDAGQRRALAQHVEQNGGGLFVLGGPRSLVPPVSADDPLDPILPVDFRPRRGTQAPGMALVVVFDKSGSMEDRIDGVPKIEFARQAAQRVLASVPPTDAIGVIAFDAQPVDVAPLQPGHTASDLTARLRGVRSAGSTSVGPAVERAVAWLRAASSTTYARRLILLISDGRTTPADEARAAAALNVPGVELSSVALGDEVDRRFLTALAEKGHGRAFFPENVRDLPAMVAREAVRVSGGRVVEGPFTPRAARHTILTGIDTSRLPVMHGYVVGAARTGAEDVLLSHLGDPVLAAWRHGLGKVAVYTADWRSPWSAPLRNWTGAAALLAQTTRWVSRRVDDPFLDTRFSDENGRLRITVDARTPEGAFLSRLDLSASARTPAGATADVVLSPAAPGLYEGSLPLADEGSYLFTITASGADGTTEARVQRGFYWSAPRERTRAATDTTLLATLASMTGGRLLQPGQSAYAVGRAADFADVRAWLTGGALLLFLVALLGPAAAALVERRAAPPAAAVMRKDAA